MNNQEAIEIIRDIDKAYRTFTKTEIQALEMAIKALEQEPKTEQEDDYFRKIVEVAISQLRADRDRLEDELAKREQEPKTGHWSHDGSHWKNRFICSECGYKLFDEQTNYCPNCGAKMIEPQESEE